MIILAKHHPPPLSSHARECKNGAVALRVLLYVFMKPAYVVAVCRHHGQKKWTGVHLDPRVFLLSIPICM